MRREDHDTVLRTYTRPVSIIATKPTSESDARHDGVNADLQHDVWSIVTDDPTKKRNAERTLAFDQVIDVGDVRLNKSNHLHDLLTLKIFVLEMLRGQYIPGLTAQGVLTAFNNALWVIRWRTSLPTGRFDSLSAPLFEDYCNRLKGGALALVPLEQRLENLCKAVENGQYTWPVVISPGRVRIDATAVAGRLGLTIKASMTSPNYVRSVQAAVQRTKSGMIIPAADEVLVEGRPGSDQETEDDGDAIRAKTARGHLCVWRDLHRLSQIGILTHDRLIFDPFDTVDLDTRAHQIGNDEVGRTRTPGPEQWLNLLDAAARWVLDYAEPLSLICKGALDIEREFAHYTNPLGS